MILRALSLALLVAPTLSLSTGPAPEPARLRILVTNDDGIASPGLHVLAKELATIADVVVCAPAGNRSGSSQSLTYLSTPKLVTAAEVEGASEAMALDGSPADAAHFGIVHLGREKPFDLVVSGMNRGANVGDWSHGSGTVGAAMEGSFRGIPSIAVSTDGRLRELTEAAAFARRFIQQWVERGLDAEVVYSINIPNRAADGWKGVRAAPMGGRYIDSPAYQVVETNDQGTVYRAPLELMTEFPEGSDTASYMDGFITVTPLRFDWTHREALADLANWELSAD